MSMPVTIDDEPNGRQISMMLTEEQFQRAQTDPEYVQELLRSSEITTPLQGRETQSPASYENTSSMFLWNEACIFLLLTVYEEYKEDFTRKRHKLVYDVIAQKMRENNIQYNVNASQCHSKINSLKKHYKKIVDHNATSGNDRATWPYFDRMNEIFGSTGWANPEAVASEVGPDQNLAQIQQNSTQTESRKRKLDSVLEEYRKDMKKYREEKAKLKQENFNKLLQIKERQHKEKMELLRSICLINHNGV